MCDQTLKLVQNASSSEGLPLQTERIPHAGQVWSLKSPVRYGISCLDAEEKVHGRGSWGQDRQIDRGLRQQKKVQTESVQADDS